MAAIYGGFFAAHKLKMCATASDPLLRFTQDLIGGILSYGLVALIDKIPYIEEQQVQR